jgi:hypothetical protein
MSESNTTLYRLEFKPRSEGSPDLGGLDIEAFRKICNRYPEYVIDNGRRWGILGVSPEDQFINDVLTYASAIGITIPIDQSVMRTGVDYRQYPSNKDLIFEQSPFTSAALVGTIIADGWFNDNGGSFVYCNSRLRKMKGAVIGGLASFPSTILIRGDMMKEKLENAGLRGLSLRPLDLGENLPKSAGLRLLDEWPSGIEPLFQIYSDVELPMCRNWMFDNCGRVFYPRDREFLPDGCMPLNGRGPMDVLHYSESEINSFFEYDVVRTYERFGREGTRILVSKRFQVIFKNLGIRGMTYNKGLYIAIDETPWDLGLDGPMHPRFSGPPPNPPVD